MEAFAHTNAPPPVNISTNIGRYCGWPIEELAYEALVGLNAHDIAAAIACFTSKHRLNGAPPKNLSLYGGAGGGGNWNIPGVTGGSILQPPVVEKVMQQYSLETMLAMRMRWGVKGNTWAPGFNDIIIRRVQDKVLVCVISMGGEGIVLEDGYELYPSDALITKLNMLKQE